MTQLDFLSAFVVNGLHRATIYAPAALAFYIVFRATKSIDFGVIATATAAVYVAVLSSGGRPTIFQIPLALASAMTLGPAIYFLLWHRVLNSAVGHGSNFLSSIALLGAAQAAAALASTASPVPFFDVSIYAVTWFGVQPFYKDLVTRLLLCGTACIVTIRMMDYALLGKRICAIGEDRFLGSLYIANWERLVGLSYLSASFLATLSVILDAGTSNLDPFSPLQVLLFGVISFLLGGQRSAKQATAGAAVWGFFEVFMENVFGLSLARALLLALCIIVIVFRGEGIGLFETKALERPE